MLRICYIHDTQLLFWITANVTDLVNITLIFISVLTFFSCVGYYRGSDSGNLLRVSYKSKNNCDFIILTVHFL